MRQMTTIFIIHCLLTKRKHWMLALGRFSPSLCMSLLSLSNVGIQPTLPHHARYLWRKEGTIMRDYKADLEKVKELKKQVRDLALDYEEEMVNLPFSETKDYVFNSMIHLLDASGELSRVLDAFEELIKITEGS